MPRKIPSWSLLCQNESRALKSLTFGITVRIDGVVCKADFVAFACGINNEICQGKKELIGLCKSLVTYVEPPLKAMEDRILKSAPSKLPSSPLTGDHIIEPTAGSTSPQSITIIEIEEEAGHILVIDLATSVSLILRDKLGKGNTMDKNLLVTVR